MPVGILLDDEGDGDPFARWYRRLDDAAALEQCRRPFSWHNFTMWWVARRWVLPDDPRYTYAEPSRPYRDVLSSRAGV